MTKNERWLRMLSKMQIDVTEEIASGELISRELLHDNKTWRITLQFDNLLTVECMNFLSSRIVQYMCEEIGECKCKFTFKYRNSTLDAKMVEEYLDEGIRVLSSVKREITIIRTLS